MKNVKYVFFVILLFLSVCLFSQITVKEYLGKVEVVYVSKHQREWKAIEESSVFTNKDKVRTFEDARLVLNSKSYIITIYPNSVVEFYTVYNDFGNNLTEINLLKGKIRFKNNGLNNKEYLLVRTKNSETSPLGTDFVIEYSKGQKTIIYVFEGKVQTSNPLTQAPPTKIDAYQMSEITKSNPPTEPSSIPDEILNLYNVPPKPELVAPVEIEEEPAPIEKEKKTVEPEPVVQPVVEEKKEPEPVVEPVKPEPTPPKKNLNLKKKKSHGVLNQN